MEDFFVNTALAARKELRAVQELIAKIQDFLKTVPEGSLNIRNIRGGTQYYQRLEGKKAYISVKNTDLPRALAQKDYYVELLKLLEQKEKALRDFQEHYPDKSIDEVFMELRLERQKLVTPVRPTDEQFVRMWKGKPYQGKGFGKEETSSFYTDNGERVRSKSEVIIANTLLRMGIPYKYECPLNLAEDMYGRSVKTVYPDFTMLDIKTRKEVYLEHFGMMDRPEYQDSFFWKMNLYGQNGIRRGRNLITTFESLKWPLDTRRLVDELNDRFSDDA